MLESGIFCELVWKRVRIFRRFPLNHWVRHFLCRLWYFRYVCRIFPSQNWNSIEEITITYLNWHVRVPNPNCSRQNINLQYYYNIKANKVFQFMSLGREAISIKLVVFNYYIEKPQKVILGKMAENIQLAAQSKQQQLWQITVKWSKIHGHYNLMQSFNCVYSFNYIERKICPIRELFRFVYYTHINWSQNSICRRLSRYIPSHWGTIYCMRNFS